MLQLIRHVCKSPKDNTQMALLYANQTENDILLRKELEVEASKYPKKFKFWFTVDTAGDGEQIILCTVAHQNKLALNNG